MSDKIRIRVSISTQKIGSKCVDEIEFERAEWESLTDEEKESECRDTAFSMMEWDWTEI